MVAATGKLPDLEAVAQKYAISPALALGLGAGLYFEYFRRAQPSPTHSIAGLRKDLESQLVLRLDTYRVDPKEGVRGALRENALRFNLDRAPTTGLLGMEMLAEELPHFHERKDGHACLRSMAETIVETHALYRNSYIEFLNDLAPEILDAGAFVPTLVGIAAEWESLAEQMTKAAAGAVELERASGLMRRLAFREEHFWGTILDAGV